MDCGELFPSYVMQFDHRPGEKKRRPVSHMVAYSREAIDEEVTKCDLVCANCHAIRTHGGRVDSCGLDK